MPENEKKEEVVNDENLKQEEIKENENVSRETKTDYSEKFEELNKSLKNINSNIRMLKNEEEIKKDDSINLFSKECKCCLVDKDNKELNDYELFKRSLKMIANDEKENKKIYISPEFINYMKEFVKNHENGVMSDTEFKKKQIFEEIPLNQIKL